MNAESVTLAMLAVAVGGETRGDATVAIDDVTHDSRAVVPGTLFVAVRGATVDGHRFVAPARQAGAAAVCVEDGSLAGSGPTLLVGDTRAALGPLAARVHGDPSRRLRLVGVTGTNGKTTVTHLIESICRAAGIPEALAGTVGAHIRGRPIPMARTTPEAPDFQRLLRTMVEAGVDIAAVEVSSHALALGRVAGTRFRVGAFTNLSQDHLDLHGDMAAYEQAKATLFTLADEGVIWVDDPAGARIAASAPVPVATVGRSPGADFRVVGERLTVSGSDFSVSSDGGSVTLHMPLPGGFNVANAAVAAVCALRLGVAPDAVSAGVAALPTVPGRFERVPLDLDFTVAVDYAHTPDGIAAVIAAATEVLAGSGRVVVVVGAGGDRDRAKRPLMGAAACRAAVAVLTTDNPRRERPEDVLAEVVAGASGPGTVIVEPDRRTAIRRALLEARPGDVVLILGKGHETTQDFGDRVVPFDDRLVAVEEAGRR